MPTDVIDCGTIFFRDGNDLEAIAEILEKFAVLLENEQGESFSGSLGGECPEQSEYILVDACLATLYDRG